MRRLHTRWTSALMLSTLAATGVAFVGRGAEAQESKDVVTVQARILQNGVPVNADLDLTFEVYTASSGGTKLWSESQSAVPVRNGILAISLGTASALGGTFKNGFNATSERWVAVKQGGVEIVPRVRLTAVPYAQAAGTAEIASTLWDGTTGTSLTLSGLVGTGLEQDGSGRLRIAGSAAGSGLTGGSGSALAVGAANASVTVTSDAIAVNPAALINGGAAEVDGDRLRIDLSSSLNYTPDSSGTGGLTSATTDLSAHLKGISNALASSADYTGDSPGGRLSASGSAVIPTTDVTAATSIYYLPYTSNRIPLWDGSKWVARDFSPSNESGINISLSGKSANTNYDVYAYWTGSAVALEIGTAWTNNTTRNTTWTTTRSNGVLVKDVSGTLDKTRRYLGTFRCLAAGQTEDSNAKRFVWNYDNRVRRVSTTRDSTTSWTYNSSTLTNVNSSNAAWKHEFVVGVTTEPVMTHAHLGQSGDNGAVLTMYLDGSATSLANTAKYGLLDDCFIDAVLGGLPGLGYHTIQAKNSIFSGSSNTTFYGSAYGSGLQTVMMD